MNQFKNLIVWKKSLMLAGKVYELTEKLPSKEKFGLTTQINRAVISISSNIAEGAGRNSSREFNYFLSIANGSSYELETQLLLCTELNYFQNEEIEETSNLIQEIQKMIYSLQSKLKKEYNNQNKNEAGLGLKSQDSRLKTQD